MKVLDFPLSKISICFILGILIAQILKPSLYFTFFLLTASILLLALLFYLSKKNHDLKIYFGYVTLFCSILFGISTLVFHTQTNNSKHYIYQIDKSNLDHKINITIKEKLKNTLKNDRYIATVNEIDGKESYGKIILNCIKDSVSKEFVAGSNLMIYGGLYPNRNPNNPNQFDYGKYLRNQQIYAQIYCENSNIKINPVINNKSLNYYASLIRYKIIKNLEAKHFNKKELNVVIALILGQQQDISQDIIIDYQYAGAIHILSVSGLHVGFILMFVTFLLKPLPNSKRGLILKLIITLISLWLFGILAGLSPSVLRSVTMFSFVAIGYFLKRSVNIYHTLLISILLILLIQPSFLFDVGFQLSYIALFFIVWLQPLLSSIWKPKNQIAKYFWDIITVSFAAQIGTFPLSIYYFHQFPGLFFVTNLIILPLLSFILVLALLVVIMAAFNYVPLFPMHLLEKNIFYMNKIISWVASFEGFIFKDIPFNKTMMIICYLILISIVIWIKKPNYRKLQFIFIAIIAFQIVLLFTKHESQKKNEFIVFNRHGYTLISERKNDKINIYSNDSILNSLDDNLVLKSYMVANFCKINKLENVRNFYFFNNKKIALIDSSSTFLGNSNPDILIFSHSPKINLDRLFKTIKPKILIADASNFKSYVKLWKSSCVKQKILFHDTTEKGFYILN